MSGGISPLAATADVQPPSRVRQGLQGNVGAAAWTALITVPLITWFLPVAVEPRALHAFALMSFVLIGWMTQVLEPAIVGLVGIYLAWALGVVPFNVAFAGFSNNTPWFLYGAMLFGAMAGKSGLPRRLAFIVMRRIGSTYPRLLLGLIVSDFLLTLMVPSGIARVVLMAAVAIAVIEAFGAGPGSDIGRGMFITLTYTATIFDKMVIAGAASITARGLIERAGGVEVLWSHWALAFLPVDLITIVLAWRLTLWLYPGTRGAGWRCGVSERGVAQDGPLERDGKAGGHPDAAGDRPVDDRFHPSHSGRHDRHGRGAAGRDAADRRSRHRGRSQGEFPDYRVRWRGDQYGGHSPGDRCAQGPDRFSLWAGSNPSSSGTRGSRPQSCPGPHSSTTCFWETKSPCSRRRFRCSCSRRTRTGSIHSPWA